MHCGLLQSYRHMQFGQTTPGYTGLWAMACLEHVLTQTDDVMKPIVM